MISSFYSLLRQLKNFSKYPLKQKYTKLYETIYAIIDSKILINQNDKVLFIDLGSNLGQGYEWFSKFFKGPNIHFELFEPNPYCYKKLIELKDFKEKKIHINNLGAGVEDGTVKFYGLYEDKYSQAGSILEEHKSMFNTTNDEHYIEVEVFDLVNYLIEKKKEFDKIIIKFDIEGIEIEILEKLISTKVVEFVDIIYVEFHSQYLEPEISKKRRKRELQIIKSINLLERTHLRIWH